AYRLQDCMYVIISEVVPLETIKNNQLFVRYAGAAALEELKPSMERVSDTEIYRRPYTPDISTGDMATLVQYWEKTVKDDGSHSISVTYVAGNVELYRIEEVVPNRFPFAILYDYAQRKSFWGK